MRHAILYITTYISGWAVKRELSTLLACLIYSTVSSSKHGLYIAEPHKITPEWSSFWGIHIYTYYIYINSDTRIYARHWQGSNLKVMERKLEFMCPATTPLTTFFFWVVTAQQPTQRNLNLIRHEFCINLIAKVERATCKWRPVKKGSRFPSSKPPYK